MVLLNIQQSYRTMETEEPSFSCKLYKDCSVHNIIEYKLDYKRNKLAYENWKKLMTCLKPVHALSLIVSYDQTIPSLQHKTERVQPSFTKSIDLCRPKVRTEIILFTSIGSKLNVEWRIWEVKIRNMSGINQLSVVKATFIIDNKGPQWNGYDVIWTKLREPLRNIWLRNSSLLLHNLYFKNTK